MHRHERPQALDLEVPIQSGVRGEGAQLLPGPVTLEWVRGQTIQESARGRILALHQVADGQAPQDSRARSVDGQRLVGFPFGLIDQTHPEVAVPELEPELRPEAQLGVHRVRVAHELGIQHEAVVRLGIREHVVRQAACFVQSPVDVLDSQRVGPIPRRCGPEVQDGLPLAAPGQVARHQKPHEAGVVGRGYEPHDRHQEGHRRRPLEGCAAPPGRRLAPRLPGLLGATAPPAPHGGRQGQPGECGEGAHRGGCARQVDGRVVRKRADEGIREVELAELYADKVRHGLDGQQVQERGHPGSPNQELVQRRDECEHQKRAA